jgi:hypothetical protein
MNWLQGEWPGVILENRTITPYVVCCIFYTTIYCVFVVFEPNMISEAESGVEKVLLSRIW